MGMENNAPIVENENEMKVGNENNDYKRIDPEVQLKKERLKANNRSIFSLNEKMEGVIDLVGIDDNEAIDILKYWHNSKKWVAKIESIW